MKVEQGRIPARHISRVAAEDILVVEGRWPTGRDEEDVNEKN